MTLQHDAVPTGAPVTDRRPRLGALVTDPAHFAAHVWGREALHTPAGALSGALGEVFGERAVDELVSERGLRTPFLRVARDGRTAGDREFTAPGGVGATITDQLSDDKLLRLFADGSTMVLQALHRTWAPLIALAQDLGAELGHPVQVNAYVTPAQSRGFDDHYDVHDVFVVQVAGRKHWRVRPPVHADPLRDQPWTAHRDAVTEATTHPPYLDVTLRPGDTLYVPRGWLHSATALGGATTHLTMGVHTWTRHHLAEQLVAEAMATLAADPEVRSTLGLGIDAGSPQDVADDLELVRARLRAAVAQVSGAAVAERMGRGIRAGSRAAPLAPLATLAAADALTDDDVVHLRPHLAAEVRPSGDGVRVVSRAGELDLDADAWARCRPLFDEGAVAVAGIGVDLARRLVVAGTAVTTGPT